MMQVECGVPEAVSLPVYTQLQGKGPKAQFAAVLRQVEAWDPALVEDMTRRYWLRAEVFVPPLFPEALQVLEELRREGHRLAVSSGSIQSAVNRKVRLTGIERLFRLILGSDEDEPRLSKGKGHFGLIAGALGMTSAELQARAAFIGDGIYDMSVAREAGIVGIGRLTGDNANALYAAGASYVLPDLRGLPQLVAST
jgi:phosphoglycolate phosphatase-like HAD superfamily hydrolase